MHNVRKIRLALIILLLVTSVGFGQAQEDSLDTVIKDLANECVSLLGKTVPNTGYMRVGRDTYQQSNDNIVLTVDNNLIVVAAAFLQLLYERHDANILVGLFCSFLEKNNWDYIGTRTGRGAIYMKGGTYAIVTEPIKRDDGIAVVLRFSRGLR
jgi:hypothetical protein